MPEDDLVNAVATTDLPTFEDDAAAVLLSPDGGALRLRSSLRLSESLCLSVSLSLSLSLSLPFFADVNLYRCWRGSIDA